MLGVKGENIMIAMDCSSQKGWCRSLMTVLWMLGWCYSTSAATDLFEYDRNAPLQVEENQTSIRDSIEVREITYSSPVLSRKVKGFLVMPIGKAPYAGVIYLHMYPGSYGQFVNEAILLAKKGAMSLLIEGLFPWNARPRNLEMDRNSIIQQIIELRRAVDLLISNNNVDPKRLAFVGMDYGAMHGSVLAGVEKRLKAYVLIAGTTQYSLWNSIINYKLISEDYDKGLEPLDPIQHIAQASPASILFQFSSADSYISEERAKQFYEAAKEPKSIQWYKNEHNSLHVISQKDRLDWLSQQLSLAEP
jgi:dienelactone hydrolase